MGPDPERVGRDGAAASAGLYACSPKGAGFVAEFTLLSIDRESRT